MTCKRARRLAVIRYAHHRTRARTADTQFERVLDAMSHDALRELLVSLREQKKAERKRFADAAIKDQREALDGKVLALICENGRRLQPHRLSLSCVSARLSSLERNTAASLQRLRRRWLIQYDSRKGWVPRG